MAAAPTPLARTLQTQRAHRDSLVEAARQTPPALLEGELTGGAQQRIEASYLWTLEGGAKARSRVKAATAEAEAFGAEADEQRRAIVLELALIQDELRRIEAKREILLETRATYSAIIKQYTRRLSLGPEQTTALAVFRIAAKDNDLRLASDAIETSQLTQRVAALVGCDQLRLPPLKPRWSRWPLLSDKAPTELTPRLKQLQLRRKSREEAWQSDLENLGHDLSLGPLVSLQREDARSQLELGITASLPIGSNRSLAASRSAQLAAERAETDRDEARYRSQRAAWLAQYRGATEALKVGLSPADLSKNHRELEALFRGEQVSAALVIEAHRQMLEHTETYAAIEAKASAAYWNLKYLDGTLSGGDL